ncbi:hypothetical protein HDU78_005262 [Chytriomyces hyalinus]|nr:hypothetical protein HDU78_005262 [Chytriomyces hyalinus]
MLSSEADANAQRRRIVQRRENKSVYLDLGERGRKTGWSRPANLPVDEFGLEDPDDYFMSDDEEARAVGRTRVEKKPDRVDDLPRTVLAPQDAIPDVFRRSTIVARSPAVAPSAVYKVTDGVRHDSSLPEDYYVIENEREVAMSARRKSVDPRVFADRDVAQDRRQSIPRELPTRTQYDPNFSQRRMQPVYEDEMIPRYPNTIETSNFSSEYDREQIPLYSEQQHRAPSSAQRQHALPYDPLPNASDRIENRTPTGPRHQQQIKTARRLEHGSQQLMDFEKAQPQMSERRFESPQRRQARHSLAYESYSDAAATHRFDEPVQDFPPRRQTIHSPALSHRRSSSVTNFVPAATAPLYRNRLEPAARQYEAGDNYRTEYYDEPQPEKSVPRRTVDREYARNVVEQSNPFMVAPSPNNRQRHSLKPSGRPVRESEPMPRNLLRPDGRQHPDGRQQHQARKFFPAAAPRQQSNPNGPPVHEHSVHDAHLENESTQELNDDVRNQRDEVEEYKETYEEEEREALYEYEQAHQEQEEAVEQREPEKAIPIAAENVAVPTLPNKQPQGSSKSVPAENGSKSTLVEKAKPMARVPRPVATEPPAPITSTASSSVVSPLTAQKQRELAGRFGRSKLGQKVLTAVTVQEVDQQQQAPAQQESATIIEESVNGDAEEETPEFASFSHSTNPDWSYPLLPTDPGYVAPSAKTKDSKKSKTHEIASTPKAATAGPSNATVKHLARRDSTPIASTSKPTSITSTKIAAASPRRASRSKTPPVSSVQPPPASASRKNASSATAEVSPPVPTSASAPTKAPTRRATRSSLVIPPLPVTSDPGSEDAEDGPPTADEDVALDNNGLDGEEFDETGGFDDVPPAAEDFDGQDDDSFGQPMDEDTQIPDSPDLGRNHESGNPEENELKEEEEEEEVAVTAKPARQQNASKATKSQGKKRPRSAVHAEENETRSKAPAESSKPVAPRKKSSAKSSASSETVVIPVTKEEEGEGRHKRARVPPVQFWKLETIQYENRRSSMGDTMVPYAVGVAKKEPDEGASTGAKKAQTSKSRKLAKKEKIILSSPDMVVMDYETNQEVEQRRIVYTNDMFHPQVVGNGEAFLYQRTYSVGNFCGSGVIILPKGVSKPNKASGSTALFIIVMHGRIRVTIYKNSFEVGQGTKVLVPRGNQYSLENTGSTDATLYFFQARDPSESADAGAGQASSSSTSKANGKPKAAPKETPATEKPKKAEPTAAVAKKTAVKEPASKPAPTRKGRGKQG